MERIALCLLFCGLTLSAQAPKPTPPTPPPAAAPAPPVTKPVSDGDRADIRELQLSYRDLQARADAAKTALVNLINSRTPKGFQLEEVPLAQGDPHYGEQGLPQLKFMWVAVPAQK